MQDALTRIAAEHREVVDAFPEQSKRIEEIESVVAECFSSEVKATSARPSPMVWLLLLAAVAGLFYWGARSYMIHGPLG